MDMNCTQKVKAGKVEPEEMRPIIDTQRVILSKIHEARVRLEIQRDRLCGKAPETENCDIEGFQEGITTYQRIMLYELGRIDEALCQISDAL